jgi:hypothetical protein
MNKNLLRALLDAKNLTLATLQAEAPALADHVLSLVREAEGARLEAALQDLPEHVRAKVEMIDLTRTTGDMVEHLRLGLVDLGVEHEDVERAVKRAQNVRPAPVPPATQPIGTLPAVAQQIATAHVHEMIAVAGLSGPAADAVAHAAPAPNALGDETLDALVSRGAITEAQAKDLGLSSALYQLLDGNTALATAIRAATFPRLGSKAPGSTMDLARLSAADWADFFASSQVALPPGSTPDAVSAGLSARFGALHPGVALTGRLPAVDVSQLARDIESLGAAQTTGLEAIQARLRQLTLAYPGLELASVMDDRGLDPVAKARIIARRTGLVHAVSAQLGDTQVLQLDLSPGSADIGKLGLDRIDATAAEQRLVLAHFQVHQRAWALAKNVDDAHALVGAGYTSALSIGRQPFAAFAAQSGLSAAKAKAIFDEARTSMADAALTAGAILDATQGELRHLPAYNQPPSVNAYLAGLPGYQDLFGSLSFCDCQECQSILGPAAYFVDLMKFIDENLRSQFKTKNHPLDLRTRRPDLWTLELSCDNTNKRVPTLDLVAEVLENAIAQKRGFGGSLTDRTAVGALVYGQTLTKGASSFRQPFHLPLARIGAYMPGLGSTRSAVADAVGASAAVRAQAELGLSVPELAIVITPHAELGYLSQVYGIAFGGTATAVSAIDAAVLGAAMAVTRAELGQVVTTTFVSAGGTNVTITSAKKSPSSVQNDVEWVSGLSADALDRMHRFTRMVRKTAWSIPDLDAVLTAIADNALGPSAVEAIAALHAIQGRYKLGVAELCALVGAIPRTPVGSSLFDRLFNPPAFVAASGPGGGLFPPTPPTPFIHPAFRQATTAPPDPALPRLLSGLSVDLGGLASLATYLAPHLSQGAPPAASGFDPKAADESARYFVLSVDNLTLLYRHARLSRLLGVSIDDLFRLLGLLGLDHVGGLADVISLLDLHAWQRQSGYLLDDVAVATGQMPRDPAAYIDPGAVAAQIVGSAAKALTFTDTVFSVALGTSERGSLDLLTTNSAVVQASPTDGSWRLRPGVDLDTVTITIPATATVTTPATATMPSTTSLVTVAAVREALRPYLASEVLVRSLGAALGFQKEKVVALAALAGQSLTADAVVEVVRGNAPLSASPPDALASVIAAVRPLAVALASSVWDAEAIDFVRKSPEVFGTESLPQTSSSALHPLVPYVSLEQLRGLSTYARLRARQLVVMPGAPAANAGDLRAVLTAYGPTGFPPSSDATTALVLGVPSGLVVGLRGQVALPTVAALALEQLDRAAQLAVALGVDGQTLGALVSDDYDTLSHAADALVAALGARFTDDAARAQKLDEAEQPVREAKRDALTEWLIRSAPQKVWNSVDELYQYFLIDVEAGGCATTSRVVSATMAAQLYVYRVIMNLERDSLPATDPEHVALTLRGDAAAEWEWRKNYRVWQANREVFLWPENYLDPDLRDDKTPLFRELESALLQTDINDENVLDAYTSYLAGLEEVASLTIAGAYHDVPKDDSGTKGRSRPKPVHDVLHLFGVSASDPPTYYYRTCQNLIAGSKDPLTAALWSPWQKIGVQITGRKVSPVVHQGRLHVFWIDIKTKSMNTVENGGSTFAGYQHQMTLKFTTLRPDGTWSAPQQVDLPGHHGYGNFGPARGQIQDPLSDGIAKLDPEGRFQTAAIDDYTLSGPNWDWAWLTPSSSALVIQFRNFVERAHVDLFGRKAVPPKDPTATDPVPPYPQLLCAKDTVEAAAAAKAVAAARAAAEAAAKTDVGDIVAFTTTHAKAAFAAQAATKAEAAAQASRADRALFCGTPSLMLWPNPAYANAVIDEQRLDAVELDAPGLKPYLLGGLLARKIATIPYNTELLAVPGSEEDGLLQVGNDVLLLQGSVTDDSGYALRRLGTTMVEGIARKLFETGLDGLLDTETQLHLAEAGLPIKILGKHVADHTGAGKLDFNGPYGVYYRELYFHIPHLIANALSSRGRFASAQRWYAYVFDPTSAERIDVSHVPPADAARRLLDRVWRYREFRGLDVETLRDILTDKVAIGLYKSDPFNPWAIARRRLSAFQKAMVMKYVENLLDWADSLFTQFTMESVNEAMMLYIMASDVLGARPTELGNCGTGDDHHTYETIGPLIDKRSDVLIESIETWTIGARVSKAPASLRVTAPAKYAIEHTAIVHAVGEAALFPATAVASAELGVEPRRAVAPSPSAAPGMFRGLGWKQTTTASWGPALGNSRVKTADRLGGRSFDPALKADFADRVGRFGWSILRQATPVFCVPVNADLLALWDRVADRLYKIRNCMNINGEKQELALFAPPIDPMQLVAMKAAGLGLDDVLGAGNGDLPPYRFTYLIERAKAFASILGGFGAALLSSLEKKDGEQLNRLRLSQQMNLTRLNTQLRMLEVEAASQSLQAVDQQLAAAQYRSEFYAGLLSSDRNGWEAAESLARHTASGVYLGEALIQGAGAIAALAPQIGSPFAMKYGGVELKGSLSGFAAGINALAKGAEAVAASTGLEATFARRSEGWTNQKTLADYDVQSLTRQQQAARIRLDIANAALTLHQKSIDQIQEMLDLTDGKFTNLGLYTWLSTRLQRVYRGAYQNALALAKLTEQAFRFERGDYASPGLASSYWDPTHAGLLAGEQLLVDLQTLERRFLETNYRTLEVDQAFALSQIDARALLDLRESGECTFTVGEVFFDLFYPGHYKRRIKAVRLTIPCITGPYVNVSASLSLLASKLRPTATLGGALADVPPSRSVSIATSTAQNDAGVFELSFRDERYMPFEGLGAVESQWHLALPKAFRQFDYQTITDVILSISYTAEQDSALRDRVEAQNATLEGSIVEYFSSNSARRVFSLRQDFSSAFTRLLRSPTGTKVTIELTDRHFPLFVRGRKLNVQRAEILLRTATGASLAGLSISVDGSAITAFAADAALGQLPAAGLPAAFAAGLLGQHALTIDAGGGLAPATPLPGDASAVDAEKLLDVLLYLEYRLA